MGEQPWQLDLEVGDQRGIERGRKKNERAKLSN
jgi:hypothetical protein